MEYNNIESLLKKYFDGETSIDQEKQLTNYFSSENVAQHLQQYQSMFKYFKNEKKATFKKEIVLKSNRNLAWFSIAASIILLAGIGTFYLMKNKQANPEEGLGTYKTPEIAFVETQKALQMLSSNVNVGINSVTYIKEYQNTKNIIFIE